MSPTDPLHFRAVPEGDSIHALARRLQPIVGETVLAYRAHGRLAAARLVGRRFVAIRARGKHLLMDFDDGRTLHSHMKMDGWWYLTRRGERWRRPSRWMSVAFETARLELVGFRLPVAELLRGDASSSLLARLGPDLLDPRASLESMRNNLAGSSAPLGEAVMNQRLVAGIGNVYKSELLFLEKLDPFVATSTLTAAQLDALLRRARKSLARNLARRGRRVMREKSGPRLWVYRRAGMPCLVCGAAIRMQRQGAQQRSTYFCPECQSVTSRT